jgi:6-phosphogluconolactonase
MRILVFDTEEVAREAARLAAETARSAIAARGRACLAFSGGRTPWPMLRALAAEALPWHAVHFFQTDERAVPPDDPARTLPQLRDALLSRVPPELLHMHPMPVEDRDLADGARRYGTILEQTAGVPVKLDLVHLGIGSDGHTASLVRGDPVLEVGDTDVAVSGPYQGHLRMTLTYPALDRARTLLWLVIGAEKAKVLRRLCRGDKTIPAGRVNPERATIVADREAAKLLPDAMVGRS